MNSFHSRIETIVRRWHKRVPSEDDVLKLCKKLKITVTFMPLTVPGYYYRCKGEDHIAVDSKKKDFQRTFTLLHELGHFVMHAPERGATASFFGIKKGTREEREADAFAFALLIPQKLLAKSNVELIEDYGFTLAVLVRRRKVFERYGV